MSEIDKLLKNSSRQNIIDFLSDSTNELEDLIICYARLNGDYGYYEMKGSRNISVLGMLVAITEYYRQCEVEGFFHLHERHEQDDC